MKRFNSLMIILIAFILVFSAIIKYEESYAMDLIYETDFSRDDGEFKHQPRGEINEIRRGVLHLKAAADKNAHAHLKRIYSNNSITTFRIKFERRVHAHVCLLSLKEDNLMLYFGENFIELITILDGKEIESSVKKINLTSGRWYEVAVSISDYTVSVSIDGVPIGPIAFDLRLPARGYLGFGCHGEGEYAEYLVDDLKIVQGPAVMKPAVMKEEQVTVSGGIVLYETDFSRDDGAFKHRPQGEINEIRRGVLHLRGIKDVSRAHADLKKVYGNNSITTFKIKFGVRRKIGRPFAVVNFLWLYNNRIIIFFHDDRLSFMTQLAGKEESSFKIPAKFKVGRWYNVQVAIVDYKLSLSIDGKPVKTLDLDRRLPSKGHLNFEAPEEYWVDDLRIIQEPAVMKEKPIEIAEEPVEIKEEPLTVARELKAEGLQFYNMEFENIFPVFFKYYDEYPIGKGFLRNYEANPITDIEVKLFIKQYMDNPKICRTPTELKGGEEKEIELNALFTNKVLEITEGTKVSAKMTIEYTLNGKVYTTEKLETIRIQNRNAITWEDDRRAAAFVTAKDPVVLKFSKNISGMIKGKGSKAVNSNFRMAMALHEALTLYGMSYVIDPTTPYKEFSKKRQEIDFLQFPKQSLDYKAGDCDDLSILYCALLESVGIETAFITIPGHIFMAFSVDMKPDEGRKRFLRADELIFKEEKTWIPVEITEIGGGFLNAWQTGAKEWRENVARGQADFYPMHEAWSKYEPVGLPGESVQLILPDRDKIVSAYLQELIKFIDREIYPQVAKIQAEIKKSKGNPKEINKLGVLYARYGLMDRAEREFKKILVKNKKFIPALVNLGNIYYLNNDMRNALTYYERASKLAPENPTVLLCVARTNHKLENYGLVREAYSSLKKVNPDLAYQFTYLDLRGEEAVRAAEISKVKEIVIWEE